MWVGGVPGRQQKTGALQPTAGSNILCMATNLLSRLFVEGRRRVDPRRRLFRCGGILRRRSSTRQQRRLQLVQEAGHVFQAFGDVDRIQPVLVEVGVEGAGQPEKPA